MKTPFIQLMSSLHRAPCFHCPQTHSCPSGVFGKLLDYSRRLKGWACTAGRHSKGSDVGLCSLAQDFDEELSHLSCHSEQTIKPH